MATRKRLKNPICSSCRVKMSRVINLNFKVNYIEWCCNVCKNCIRIKGEIK